MIQVNPCSHQGRKHTGQVQSCWKIWIFGSNTCTLDSAWDVLSLQSLTNTNVCFRHGWNNVCRQLGRDVLHLIPAERHPVWTFEAQRTHKQCSSVKGTHLHGAPLKKKKKSWPLKGRYVKGHNALFPWWLSGWSRVWLNTCCVAQCFLNEAHTDIPPAGRSGTYSNCDPPAEDQDNEQQRKCLCRKNWQHLNPRPPVMGQDKTIEALLKCAFGLKCSTSPCF